MKIYVWGVGRGLGHILDYVLPSSKVTAFVDNFYSNKTYLSKPVLRPEQLSNCNYDAVIVACAASQQIKQQCIELKLDLSKFIFTLNSFQIENLNPNLNFVAQVLGSDYASFLKYSQYSVRTVESDSLSPENRKNNSLPIMSMDYVRCKNLELAAKEIQNYHVPGAIAEFGVFKGEFAALLNRYFPRRKLYLFDTFSGFDCSESQYELKQHNCNQAFIQAFTNTSINEVKAQFCYPDKIEFRQGFFPETTVGLEEEKYALVSIDVDFEKSTLAGLEYFFPRLSSAGYIFLHDYNSRLKGVRDAVLQYEKQNNLILRKLPICDANGTLIIIK